MDEESHKDPMKQDRPRILIVEDEKNIRRSLSFILGSGFEVTTVESGDKAYELIQQGTDFDVVSLDLDMPGMSAIETLKAIRKSNPDMEVLIVTAYSNLAVAKEALKWGAYDFIDKPFRKDEFRDVIQEGVERRRKTAASETAKEELALVKAQLMQSEKFAALGQLIAGFAHELNNPLGAILGYSDLLLMEELSPEKARDYLVKINKGAQLCRTIMSKFLAFSRKHEKKREPVQINAVIESTLGLTQHDLEVDRVEVFKYLADNMPETMADFYELQEVFLNVINNAHQAMKEHSETAKLTILTEFDDQTIRIRFDDTGPGIPKENLQKIFEPLFTTKQSGKGTGLGLSLSCKIIEEHEGDIYVASKVGEGTSILIELPIVAPASQKGPPMDSGGVIS